MVMTPVNNPVFGGLLLSKSNEHNNTVLWQTNITGKFHRGLLRFSTEVNTDGLCLRHIGENYYTSGISIRLQAFSSQGTVLEQIEQVWAAPSFGCTLGTLSCSLLLRQPCEMVSITLILRGKGSVSFRGFLMSLLSDDMNNLMVDELISEGCRISDSVAIAMRHVLRSDFLSGRNGSAAYANTAVVIKSTEDGAIPLSSCSQPNIVASLLTDLAPAPGHKVLEIGTGSGYNAALLATLIADPKSVWTIDCDADLCESASENLIRAGIHDINIIQGDGWHGLAEASPYDRIIVTASAYDIPCSWFDQLSEGGRLTVPLDMSVWPQRALTFQKEQSRLRLISSTPCAFMGLRGPYGATKAPMPSIVTKEVKPRLVMLPKHTSTKDELLWLIAFLSWPYNAGMFNLNDSVLPHFGLYSPDLDSACVLDGGDPATALITWGENAYQRMKLVLDKWEQLGSPSLDEIGMFITRCGTLQEAAPNELIVHRRWMDVVITESFLCQ